MGFILDSSSFMHAANEDNNVRLFNGFFCTVSCSVHIFRLPNKLKFNIMQLVAYYYQLIRETICGYSLPLFSDKA